MTENLRQLDAPHHPRPPEGRTGLKVDLTINIPTMLTMLGMVAGIVTFGLKTYQELASADANQQKDIAMLRVDVDRVSASQIDLAREFRNGTDAIRRENREDFKEVRAGIDNLKDRLAPARQETVRGWTK